MGRIVSFCENCSRFGVFADCMERSIRMLLDVTT